MIQRFLFNRIDTKAAAATIGRKYDAITRALPHKTEAALSFVQLTKSRAKSAFDATIWQHHPPAAWIVRLYERCDHWTAGNIAFPSSDQNQAGPSCCCSRGRRPRPILSKRSHIRGSAEHRPPTTLRSESLGRDSVVPELPASKLCAD